MARMKEIFCKRDENGEIIENEYLDGYVPFTNEELQKLEQIPCVIVGADFFQNRKYGTEVASPSGKVTDFYNPQTLKRNHWLHEWGIMATSPFENAVVFTIDPQSVTSVSVSPSSATVSKGQNLNLKASVSTTGFANQAVIWSINDVAKELGASINQAGKLDVPSDYDTTGNGTAGVFTIDIDTILETGDIVSVDGVSYTVDATSQDTIAKQITALKSALNTTAITDNYTIGGTSTTCTLTQKSGKYGQVTPAFNFTPLESSSGECAIEETTEGVIPNNTIVVTATSVYDNTKTGKATITVA